MNKDPLITAIITTYKRPPQVVCRAVQSVLNQTYKHIELIIVDDSPSEFEYRNEIQHRIQLLAPSAIYIKNETNKGACESRNIGANLATGDILGFLDDDDEWEPEKIEIMIKSFTRENVALVYCGANRIDEKGDMKAIIVEWRKGNVYKELLYSNFIGSASFPLIQKQAFFDAGQFDPLMQSSQDHDMWLRIAKIKEIEYVKTPLVKYYIHTGEQITKNTKAVLSGQIRMYEKYNFDIMNDKLLYWKRTLMLSSAYGNQKILSKAICYWCKAVIKYPTKVVDNLKVLYFSIIKRFFN